MHLLLIEDDRQFIQLVEQVVQSLELSFTACTTAKEGLGKLDTENVDILVVDGLLPDKSGWKILEELQERPGPRPRTVFLSAFYRDLQSFRRLKSLGVTKVLHKPISAHALRAELGALVTESRREAEARSAAKANAAAGFAAELQRMQRAYAEKLATISASEFTSLIERAVAGDSDVVPALVDFCHRLSGTAGSYGLRQVSYAAGRLEVRLRDQPVDTLIPDLKALLALLERSGRDDEKGGAVSLTDRFRMVVVVTEQAALFRDISTWLAQVGVAARSALPGPQAMAGILHWWPDLVIVDSAAMVPGRSAPRRRAPGFRQSRRTHHRGRRFARWSPGQCDSHRRPTATGHAARSDQSR